MHMFLILIRLMDLRTGDNSGTGKEEKKNLPSTKQKSVPCPVSVLEQKKLNWKIKITHVNISSFSCVPQDS